MSDTAISVAKEFHEAWTSGRLEDAFLHVNDDVVVKTPDGEIRGIQAHKEYLKNFSEINTGVTNLAAFGDDRHAVLFYYPHTAITQTAPAAEFFTVVDGKIVADELVFDRKAYEPPAGQ